MHPTAEHKQQAMRRFEQSKLAIDVLEYQDCEKQGQSNRVRLLSGFDANSDRFQPIQDERERNTKPDLIYLESVKYEKGLEARAGIEPAHKGFADLSLTTWVPRLGRAADYLIRSRPP